MATTVRYNGLLHGFSLLNALAKVPQVQAILVQAIAKLKKYLSF
ncbi:MAG: hypothetical protein ACRYFZ_07970 [Janthinobacterium lividum]